MSVEIPAGINRFFYESATDMLGCGHRPLNPGLQYSYSTPYFYILEKI